MSKSSSFEWVPRKRDFQLEKKFFRSHLEGVTEHPLRPLIGPVTESKSIRKNSSTNLSSPGNAQPRRSVTAVLADPLGAALDGMDPLSQFAKEEQDPLSKMAAEDISWDHSETKRKNLENLDEEVSQEEWTARKSAILSRFTTSEKLSIMTSFLSGGDKVIARPQAVAPPQNATIEKVKNRLEQLDEFEEGTVCEEGDLTQGEYTARIEQLNAELKQAWNSDQRVKALKIAIQCSKLLADTNVIQFYPSKFVLVTDILDIFGQLVHERLRSKAEGNKTRGRLPVDFTPDMVPEAAKETCRNWFYKIASIRELVPRFYVEIAILRSYSFLTSSEFTQALLRLTAMIRGIGDPLVAVYARCYLCRVGLSITRDRAYIHENLYDFLASHKQLYCRSVRAELLRQKVDMGSYLTLYTPALDWILRLAANPGTEEQLLDVLNICKNLNVKSGLVLNSVMVAFKAVYIAARATQFVDLITGCDDDGFPQYILFRTLGLCVVAAEPPREQHLPLLNPVWKIVSRLSDVSHYAACAEVWIEFAVKYFGKAEVNAILHDMIRHLTPNRAFENHYLQMQSVVTILLRNTHDPEILFGMDKFLTFIDMFHKETIKVEVCKSIMEAYCRQKQDSVRDPVVINSVMFLCRVLHDSVNALTVDDEKRQIAQLICGFVKSVDFGRDFELQLNFYVDARAAFTNLDYIHVQLVQCVNHLAVKTKKIVGGHHTRKTASFVRACAAYCFITVPSIFSVIFRLELYLLSGQVALSNQCLGQADACFKAALNLILEFPKTIEEDGKQKSSDFFLVSYMSNFMSTLLIVPDPPEQGVLYITRGLLNCIQHYEWENPASKMNLYLQVLSLLAAATQESYPYHIEKVASNDALYGSDPKFVSEINRICGVVVEEIFSQLRIYDENGNLDKQASLSLALLNRIITFTDLREPISLKYAGKLWDLSHRHKKQDPSSVANTLQYLSTRAAGPNGEKCKELLSRIQTGGS
ncbi:VPS35 endosomal protein-sorting factor-like [Neocloeon triangulifer]|uniref:VPS35 endosomal protein-sorting factor-like n=1 Tax=Neocloeon triangulifer TaxID=2078957 RepID=UPI00286F811D|nr:VPS35 endosomal protein-sorting factor-like [Neocloeon triangulifer]